MSVNRAWWDERAGLHGTDRVYDTAGFLAGGSRLRQLEVEVAGDVHGQDVVHLQCHTGMDTLSCTVRSAAGAGGCDQVREPGVAPPGLPSPAGAP